MAINRRNALVIGSGLAATVCRFPAARADDRDGGSAKSRDSFPVRYCLNTGTIRGHELPLRRQLIRKDIALDHGREAYGMGWPQSVKKFESPEFHGLELVDPAVRHQ